MQDDISTERRTAGVVRGAASGQLLRDRQLHLRSAAGGAASPGLAGYMRFRCLLPGFYDFRQHFGPHCCVCCCVDCERYATTCPRATIIGFAACIWITDAVVPAGTKPGTERGSGLE